MSLYKNLSTEIDKRRCFLSIAFDIQVSTLNDAQALQG